MEIVGLHCGGVDYMIGCWVTWWSVGLHGGVLGYRWGVELHGGDCRVVLWGILVNMVGC